MFFFSSEQFFFRGETNELFRFENAIKLTQLFHDKLMQF